MKARAYILTIGASLALITPATQAATAGNALCSSHLKGPASNAGTSHKSLSRQGSRALQLVVLDDGIASSQPVRTPCAANKITAAEAPNRYQVLRNSL